MVAPRIAVLAAVVVLVLLGLDFIFTRYLIFAEEYSNQGKVKRLIENENPNEIPVFGASLARSSFIPDSISPHCYNYGMGKALYDVSRIMLDIECAKDKEAPIIFELNFRTFIRDPESTINASTFIPHLNHPVIRKAMIDSDLHSWHYEIPGLRYYGNYFNYGVGPLRRLFGDKADSRGAILEDKAQSARDVEVYLERMDNILKRRRSLLDKSKDQNRVFTPIDELTLDAIESQLFFSADEEYVEEFEAFVRNNRHRKFILVTVPINPLLKTYMLNFSAFTDFAKKLEASHENIHYLDYSDLPTEMDYFKNPPHFGTKGAKYFMQFFSRDFRKITGIAQDGSKSLILEP